MFMFLSFGYKDEEFKSWLKGVFNVDKAIITENSDEPECERDNCARELRESLGMLTMAQYFKFVLTLKCYESCEIDKFKLFNTLKDISDEVTFASISSFYAAYFRDKSAPLDTLLSLLIDELSERREKKILKTYEPLLKQTEIELDHVLRLLDKAELPNIVECVLELRSFYELGGERIDSLSIEEIMKIYEIVNVFYEEENEFDKELELIADLITNFSSGDSKQSEEIKISNSVYDLDELDTVVDKLRRRGIKGLMSMHKQFYINCSNLNKINLADLGNVLKLQRFEVSGEDYSFKNFFKGEFLDFNKFIQYFKMPLNDLRKEVTSKAYFSLATEGKLNIETVRLKFNAMEHPSVKSGARDEEDILIEFFDSFELHYNYFVLA